jgi:hypothetical protein
MIVDPGASALLFKSRANASRSGVNNIEKEVTRESSAYAHLVLPGVARLL